MSQQFWPADLVQALVQRRGVVFLGAGAAASCVSSSGARQPDWVTLLELLGEELHGSDRDAFESALGRSRLLDAAQIVVDVVPSTVLHDKLIKIFNNPSIQPSDLYDYVNLIDQQVVMTTNYDRMYERYWERNLSGDAAVEKPPLMVSGYSDGDVVDHLRSDRRVLLKLHGSIDRPKRVVLSRSQYSQAKYEFANYYAVVSALMLTRTMLFIGTGFSGDPDIDLLLEDSAFAAQSSATHYALVPAGRHSSELASLESGFNIRAIEYDNSDGDHANLLVHLRELSELVVGAREAQFG